MQQGQEDGLFDASNVEIPFLQGFGTQYHDAYKFRSVFHPNKTDDKGNTMLLVAAQNGAQKVCELLVNKGANPNHQNAVGHTGMHYAITYGFFDCGSWFADPDGGGADDSILNMHGLGVYDGLDP